MMLVVVYAVSCAPQAPSQTGVIRPQVKACIHMRNDSRRQLAVGLDGPEQRYIRVNPRSSAVVYLEPGVYKYAVAARGSDALTGEKEFTSRRIYKWNFGVSGVRAD